MDYRFEKLRPDDAVNAIGLLNYYVENSMAAYPEKPVDVSLFDVFLHQAGKFPAYAIWNKDEFIGFGMLRKYKEVDSFAPSAQATYFISPDYTGKGIGSVLLKRLITEGRALGLTTVLATICSENKTSIAFHKKHGFETSGRLKNVGLKNGVQFDELWMQKML